MAWLDHYPDHPEAGQLLATLSAGGAGDPGIRARALAWLDRNQHHTQAYRLLTSLLASASNDFEIRTRVAEWRDTRHSCFIVGSAGVELDVLQSALVKRNIAPVRIHELTVGQSLSPLIAQMREADFVCIIFPAGAIPPNVTFEAGVAIGLGKPALIIRSGRLSLPFDLTSNSIVRLESSDLSVLEMHLDESRCIPFDVTSAETLEATEAIEAVDF